MTSPAAEEAGSAVPPDFFVVVVLGATGTGKSQLGIDLALEFNGEIVNADALQVIW
jgi:tRNA dimethylallyltransferase